MDDVMLERLLTRAAAETAYPPTPPLRATVLAAIAAPDAARSQRIARYVAAGAFALVLIIGSIALAVPSSRSAIADFFGIEGTQIERLPTPPAGVTPTPLPTPAGISVIATPTTLEAAGTRLAFAPALPPGPPPSGVYLVPFIGDDPFVVLQYDRFDLWEGRVQEGLVGKAFGGSTVLTDLTVRRQSARWLSGGEHIVYFVAPDGARIAASQRTVARNTLVWRTGFALYRMETDLSLEDAKAIAEELP